MKNKKSQFGLISLYDASNLPKWILYPLLILICLILLVVFIVMILFIISYFKGDTTFMPFSMFGYYGIPIAVGSFHTSTQECFQNNQKINCSEIDLHLP
jgi:hypothetical protein